MKLIYCLLISLMMLPVSSWGQGAAGSGFPSRKDYRTWNLGVSAGPTLFQGDANPKVLERSKTDLGYGLDIGKHFTHNYSVHAQFISGHLSGEDAVVSFEAPFYEITLTNHLTIGNISFVKRNQRLNLYGFFGMGIINYKSTSKVIRKDSILDIRGPIAEGCIPLGFGAKYRIGQNFHINAQLSYRKTLTDKIDGLDFKLSEFDGYSYLNLGIVYAFGQKKKEPIEWVNPLSTIYSDISLVKSQMDQLSIDSDGDGVADVFDKDNSTPSGQKVYGDGTLLDSDGDGIPDYVDEEPFSARGVAVDSKGKAIDTDGDGVPDYLDLEANTPAGTLVNFQGKTINITNISGGGAAGGFGSGYLPAIYFESDKYEVKEQYSRDIAAIARLMQTNPKMNLKITGNTDRASSEQYNEKLGMRRAEAVRDIFVNELGLSATRFQLESKGKADPLAKSMMGLNRRVDFTIVNE